MSQQTWPRRLLGILMLVTVSGQLSASVWCQARCLEDESTNLAAARETGPAGCHLDTPSAPSVMVSALLKAHACTHGTLPSVPPASAPIEAMSPVLLTLSPWPLEPRAIADPPTRRRGHAALCVFPLHSGVLRV